MKHYIYLLIDPNTEEVRYVGQSKNPKLRFQDHLYGAYWVKSKKRLWIDGLREKGQRPILSIIFHCSNEDANYWESFFGRLFQDCPLLNEMPFRQ